MRLTVKEKQKAARITAARYQKASKKKKGAILDEFIALTGYDRCYASYLLKNHGRKVWINNKVIVVGDIRKRHKRQRQRTYGEDVLKALKQIWLIMDCICGKRLRPMLKEILAILQRHKEIKVRGEIKKKLLRISASTIDRILRPERKKYEIKGRSLTKPGTLLKHQIPIRTFSDWDEQKPGFVEIDLVGHEGGNPRGDFIQTLNVTDVCTGWTDMQAVKNKAQIWVFEALKDIRGRLPFDLLGIDSDNGGEFINDHLVRFCREEQITFTRSRSYRKNDNCFIEQKNYTIVRRYVGYARYETDIAQKLLNELYGHLRLYVNFFQPVMKLIQKTRIGSRVRKKYDEPQTPYQRVLASPFVPEKKKETLRQQYVQLNPAALRRKIANLQDKLFKLCRIQEHHTKI
jgi:hypothetical protein